MSGKPHPPHWYRRHVGECPVCGKDRSYRERVLGRPPRDRHKRVVRLSDFQTYDGCLNRQ